MNPITEEQREILVGIRVRLINRLAKRKSSSVMLELLYEQRRLDRKNSRQNKQPSAIDDLILACDILDSILK